MISIYPIWLCIQNCLVNWDYTYISMASNDKLKCMCTCASLHLSFLSLILIIFCIILCIIIHNSRKREKWCFFQLWCEVKETSNFNTQAEWRHTWETEKKIKDEISVAAAGLSNYQHTAVTRTGPNRQKQCTPWQLWNETPQFKCIQDT